MTEELLELLSRYQILNPCLRIGQILSNISYPTDVFYIEDKELVRRLKKELEGK